MPDTGVGFYRDSTARDRPTIQGPKYEYIRQKSDWKAAIARHNGRESFPTVTRRRVMSTRLVQVSGETPSATKVALQTSQSL